MKSIQKIMMLGSGELGKEVVIAAKRLGKTVIAVDRYPNAPAMQMADDFEVIDMLNADELASAVNKHQPDLIIPEIEAIRTEKLKDFEAQGIPVVPTAEAAHLTMNRDAIRDVAAHELGLKTAPFAYAANLSELQKHCQAIGFPCVIKPVMSSSGKGQSVVHTNSDVKDAWGVANSDSRGEQQKVIVEAFIQFDLEITLLTVKQHQGETLFLDPIGHRQERGDYQESWVPAKMSETALKKVQLMAKKVTDRLGGAGIFGVEFFIKEDQVYFSELSPRPHDTGMVTLISQNLSEFDLHVRAMLGLPIPAIQYWGPAASAVILAPEAMSNPAYFGLEKALAIKDSEIRIFGKPTARKYRRMGVALATASSTDAARKKAQEVADCVRVENV